MTCAPLLKLSSALSASVTDLPDSSLGSALRSNQQTYERLQTCLSLSLRRQIFIGVCDDLRLRDRLALQLQVEFSDGAARPGGSPNANASSNLRQSGELPQLVTLDLNLQDPNPLAQVSDWLSQAAQSRRVAPAFQILGIERLTRQSGVYQNLFLAYLQEIEAYLPVIESGLLLWMTQPWFRMLPEAAPEFWRCHTGVFEFVGDPTPLLASSPERIQLDFSSGFAAAASRDWADRNWADRAPQPSISPATPPTNPWLALADDLSDDPNRWYEPEQPEPEQPEPEQPELESESKWNLKRPADLPEIGQWITDSGLDMSWLKPPDLEPELGSATEPAASSQAAPTATLTPPALPSLRPDPLDPLENLDTLEDPGLLQHIGSLQQQLAMLEADQASPLLLATAYQTLGNFYRDCIEQGDLTPENLAMAIQAYEQSLQCQAANQPAELPAELLNDLGNLYWSLAQIRPEAEETIACLQRALQLYQQALESLDPQQRETIAMLQNNLGGLYADLAHHQEPIRHLEQSVQAYEYALQCRTIAADPIRYASTQNNLGTTYWNLAQHQQPAFNLKQAIVAYAEALQHYRAEQEPLHYAMIQNNLGTAYWNLAQYQPAQAAKDSLLLALLAYQAALQHRTLELHPTGFAASQNNLGTAYWHLASQSTAAERRSYLEQAILAYKTALETADYLQSDQPEARLSFDLSATRNNLGLAYSHLASDPETGAALADYLESALRYHLLAWQGWEHQAALRPTAASCILQTLRAFYRELGLAGQHRAMTLLPSQLLAEILPKL